MHCWVVALTEWMLFLLLANQEACLCKKEYHDLVITNFVMESNGARFKPGAQYEGAKCKDCDIEFVGHKPQHAKQVIVSDRDPVMVCYGSIKQPGCKVCYCLPCHEKAKDAFKQKTPIELRKRKRTPALCQPADGKNLFPGIRRSKR